MSKKSKLSSLFGMDKTSSQGGNESLTFTAPKQPKKAKDQQQPATQGQSALLLAVAVHAYRFSNGTYIKHGKLGAAILGNHTANDYKILLYISKQQQVTHARITPTFPFTVQANNYATFYDEQRQNWSIMFESEQNAIDFAKQVGLAKVNSAGGVAKALVSQDLTIGLGDAVQSGDSVEVKYTGWLYSSRSFGDVFDSNTSIDKPFRFKIGKGKVIKGWEEGVVGMKKNGRRLLIVPPALAYGKKGLGSRIPPNATLLFDVEIKKLKFSREKEEHAGSLSSDAPDGMRSEERIVGSPKISRSKDSHSSSDNESKLKHNNNSEPQLSTSPSSSKAKLISRMAKMGQPMLPLAGAVVGHDSTDSEADEASASSDTAGSPGHQNMMPKKAMKVPRKMHNNHGDMSHAMHANTLPRMGDPGVHQVALYQPQAQNQHPGAQAHLTHQGQAPGLGLGHPQGLPTYPLHQQPQAPQPPPPSQQQQHTYYQPPQHIPQQNPGQNPLQHQLALHPQGGMYAASAGQQALVSQQQMAEMQMVPIVLTEARQHHSDIKSAVGKVSDRIDDLCKKVGDIQPSQSPSISSSQATMEATVLMSNIQRIVQENERLKKEVYEKTTKVERQNEKISELLQKNQLHNSKGMNHDGPKKYVEESNSLLERTNDSYKMTATNSQQRVLELEQEKVQMTSELSNATSKISSLQMDLTNVQQRESQLRQQLNGALNNSHENKGELDHLKQQLKETDNKYKEVMKNLKDERQLKKQLENRVTSVEEELSEMKLERDVMEKNLAERKRKAAAEKQKSEEDQDEMKKSYEEELSLLKSKIRQQKTSVDAATAEQVAQVEREMENSWRERSDRLLQQAKDKHEREAVELKEEKENIAKKLAATEAKMITLRSSGENKDEVENMKKQLEEMEVWKEKYDGLHSSAVSMKERYEARIKELIQEKAQAAAASASVPPTNIVDEVKKVMNNVYHSLRGEIDTSDSYKGAEVLNIIMNTIKVTMVKVVQSAAKKQQEGDEDEDEDEDDEEEESEEEEDDDEDEEEEEDEPAVKAPVTKTTKIEVAVPVGSAPPSEETIKPTPSSQESSQPRVVVEEQIQRVEEQVVESARQEEQSGVEREEDNEEEEDEVEEEEEEEEEQEVEAEEYKDIDAEKRVGVEREEDKEEEEEGVDEEEEVVEEDDPKIEGEKEEVVETIATASTEASLHCPPPSIEVTEPAEQAQDEEQEVDAHDGPEGHDGKGDDVEEGMHVEEKIQEEEKQEVEDKEEEENEKMKEQEEDGDSLNESKKDEDDDFWSAASSEAEEEGDLPSMVTPSGPPEHPPHMPPEAPPQLPPEHPSELTPELHPAQQEEDDEPGCLDAGDKPRALSNIPDLPGGIDMEEEEDEPDPFSAPDPKEEEADDEREEEEEEQEEEEEEDIVAKSPDPLPIVLDREPPELPPELPPDDEDDSSKKAKTKKEDISSGIFGDDDDDDNLFSIPVSSKKKVEKKKPTPVKPAKKPEEEDDPFKPGPPPPLFGDEDEDDLEWFS